MKKLGGLLGVLFLAGCYTMNMDLKVAKDDSGTAVFVVDMPYTPPEEGQTDTTLEELRATMKNMAQGKKGARLLKYDEKVDEENGTITLTAKYSYDDFNEFFAGDEEGFSFNMDKKGKNRTITCRFKQDSLMPTELPANATAEDSSAAALAEMANLFLTSAAFNLTLDVEGTVSEHDADSLKDGKLYWSVPFYAENPTIKVLTVKYTVK